MAGLNGLSLRVGNSSIRKRCSYSFGVPPEVAGAPGSPAIWGAFPLPAEAKKAAAAWAPRVLAKSSSAISRYANFDGPDTAEVGQPFPIVFALKEQQTEEEKQNQASVKTEPDGDSALTPEGKLAFKLDASKQYWDIDVDLAATGFIAEDGRWTGRIRLPRHGDSEKVRFVLTPRVGTLGQKWMTLRLWHDGQPLGSVSRPIEVTDHASPRSALQPVASRPSPVDAPGKGHPSGLTKTSFGEVKKSTPKVLIDGPPTGSDLEVSIQYDDPDKLGPALLIIRTPRKSGEVVERINTPSSLLDYLEREYERLLSIGDEAESNEKDETKQSKKERLITTTEAIGNNLYREYVPQQLKDAILFLEKNNKLASMQISTNSPIFPWELVFPDKRGNGAKPEFFGIAFRIARWSVRNSISQLEDPVPLLNFAQLHAFAPPYTNETSLPAQQREINSLKQAKGFQLHESNFKSLKLLMGTHIDGFVHFAGHGDYAPTTKKVPLYSIMLSDGVLDPMTWRQMAQNAAFGNPFIFFNACDTGRSRSYGGFVQGWGPVILSTGAGGFLGAMWPLLDNAAADFAQGFYDQLSSSSKDESGVFVADVLRNVRRRFYTTGDPTYLAYVFYGNANLRVSTLSQ